MALTPAQKQQAYRDRLAKAGKVYRLIDASAAPVAFDPETQIIVDRTAYEALSKAADRATYLKDDRDRWYNDCMKAEKEQKAAEWKEGQARNAAHLLRIEIAALKQEIADMRAKPRRKPG